MNLRRVVLPALVVVLLALILASVASAAPAPAAGVFQSPLPDPEVTPVPEVTPLPEATPLPTEVPGDVPRATPELPFAARKNAVAPATSQRTAALNVTGLAGGQAALGREFVTHGDFSIQVASGPGMTGAELYLAYDPRVVTPVQAPGMGVVEITNEFFGVSTVGANELLNPCPIASSIVSNGPCLHVVVGGPEQTYKTGTAMRFHWTCTAAGRATFAILKPVMSLPPMSEPRTAFIDADGYLIALGNVLTAPIDCGVVTRIDGTVLRQGVPPAAGAGRLLCTKVVATSGTNNYGPVYTDASGNFSIDNLPAGTYTVKASYNGYLAAVKTATTSLAQLIVNIGQTRLLGGDVTIPDNTGDGVINILDIGRIISLFAQTGRAVGSVNAPCPNADDGIDINDDSIINISDLAIAAGNWGKTFSPWP